MRCSIVALAFSATVASAFKFGVTVGSNPVQYLKADGVGSPNIADGADCAITAGTLKCAGLGMPEFSGDMTQLKGVQGAGSKGWSLEGDQIKWANRDFSFWGEPPKAEIWGEKCPHGHFQVHGSAKAYETNATAV